MVLDCTVAMDGDAG